MIDASKMTDGEIANELVDVWRWTPGVREGRKALVRRARELLCAPTRTDVPSVADIHNRMNDLPPTDVSDWKQREHCAQVAHSMMLELQRPECTAPIHGMTLIEITAVFIDECQKVRCREGEDITESRQFDLEVCARVAYHLAQPILSAPAVDPDAEAKKLEREFAGITGGSTLSDHEWRDPSYDNIAYCNFWRAVAAAAK